MITSSLSPISVTRVVRSSSTQGLSSELTRVQSGRVAEVGLLGHLDEALAGGDLVVDRDRVLEVAEQDVGLLGHVRDLGRHLLVRGVEEVDHPRGPERHLEIGSGAPMASGLTKSRGFRK